MRRWLLIWLCMLSAVAYDWPRLWIEVTALLPELLPPDWDPFALSKAWLPWVFAVTMLAVGAMLPAEEVGKALRDGRRVLLGTMVQYVAMPALAFLFARLLVGDDIDATTGLIMAGCVPGAMASNVLTLLARGNTSYSVCLTTSATLLSPILVPLAMWITLGEVASPKIIGRASLFLILTVVLPVAVGHLAGRNLTRHRHRLERVGSTVANSAILWIIAVVVATNREQITETHAGLLAALLGLNLTGYAVGYAAGTRFGLPEAMRRALTLEVGMQNAGLGATLALKLFPDRTALALPAALYTFLCMFTGTLLAQWWYHRSIQESNRQRASA